ncbi:MAG: penicillin-binding protein 2, partial [Pseudomonadota bacterium]|nr:penicillin-binding protein 2 [Pseudomonadota bacterium]
MFQAQDNKEIKRLHLRIKFLSFCFFLGFLVLSAKILYLANLSLGSVISITESDIHNMKRPNIYDRNGHLVASNIAISSVAIRPNLLRNKEDIVDRLLSAVPSFQREDLEYKIFNDKKFVWLKRGITPSEQDRIHNLGIPGIQFIDETKRFYSSANTLSSVIGYVNIDNIGQAGVEKFIDQQVESGNSWDVYLSADLEVSHAMRDELIKSMNEYSSIAAAGVLMDINNGEVIAAVSLPDFDPQNHADALLPENMNKVTNSLYEIGSTFKPFTIAMALDSGLVDLDTEYDARKPIIIGGHTISDFRPQERVLTVSEIFTHSSNIGAAKIALDFGTDYHKAFLKKLGLLDPVSTQIQNLPSSSIPANWKEINTMTISYGYGISVTPLHAAVAGATLFNGGRLLQPSFLKVEDESNIIYKQVL